MTFQCPRRPNHGIEGRSIVLRANHFAVRIPGGNIQHYSVDVQPDKCPRRVNRFDFMFLFLYQYCFLSDSSAYCMIGMNLLSSV